jgi:hypothetical protein
MGSLKRIVGRIVGLSTAVGTIAVSGRIVIFLAFALIAILALTGTFGPDRYRDAAQAVLAILLGPTPPRATGSPRSKPAARPARAGQVAPPHRSQDRKP